MNCNGLREFLPDLASGSRPVSAETERHLRECPECSNSFESLRQTMALLDEWQVPEPSPYFDVRLRARVREEVARPASGWQAWLRKPALSFAMAVLLIAGVGLFRTGHSLNDSPNALMSWDTNITAEPGTAVGDLQSLDKNNEDLYANFDILDELQVQQAETP